MRRSNESAARARWRRLIEEQERSGLSVREFAARRGLSAWSLYGWRSRLGRGRRTRAPSRALVPVDVLDTERVAPPPNQASGIEIFVGERALVRVPHGFDAAELERVLGAVKRSC